MKSYFLPLLILIFMAAGCRMDEAGFPQKDQTLLLGKWLNKKTTTFTPAQNGASSNTSVYTAFTPNDYISFTTTTATMSEGFTNSVASFKYSVTGSTLTLTTNGNPPDVETQTIAKLTTDSLVLLNDASVIVNGVTTIYKVTERYARK